MNHLTLPRFWQHYHNLPQEIQQFADRNYALLKSDPFHPSLRFKKIGRTKALWSVRVGERYRALGRDKPEGIVWFWIGIHAEYEQIIARN